VKLKDKQKVVVQVYTGRKFGTVIGSSEGLIGILLDNGEYIDVPQERVRIVSVEVEVEKTRAISNNKKCLCCGKLYPSDTDQERCTCEREGWLFAVGTWHQPKVGGGTGGN